MANKKIVVELERNYDTEAFVRFDEAGVPKGERALGSLYVRKETLEKLGEPDNIKLTLESND
jgi:hypothetical protein